MWLYFIQLIAMSALRLATGYNIIIENQCDYPFFLLICPSFISVFFSATITGILERSFED